MFIEGDAVGELMLYGRGAGGAPTASAVLGDLVDAAKNLVEGRKGATIGALAPKPDPRRSTTSSRSSTCSSRWPTAPVCSRAIAAEFGKHGVSIRSMQQRGIGDDARLIFVTHKAKESDLRDTVHALRDVDAVHRVGAVLRVDGRGGMSVRLAGVIEAYREHLPVTDATPVVTLLEGNTPLARRAADRAARRRRTRAT